MIRDLARRLAAQYQATEQPIQQRGTILPLGIYEDGSAHLAWPGLIMDGIEGWGNLQDGAAAERENPSLLSLLGQGEDESFDDPFLASLLQRYGN